MNEIEIQLLLKWLVQVRVNAVGHCHSSTRFERLNYILGIPVVVLTTVVGTSVFASLETDPSPYLQIGVGIISISAAVLASLQTFLGYSDRAGRHSNAATRYGALQKRLEQALVLPPDSKEGIKEFFDQFRVDFEEQRKLSPNIPHEIWVAAKKNTSCDESIDELVAQVRARNGSHDQSSG